MTRISLSWLDLKPNRDNYKDPEDFSDYIKRIRKTYREFNHIPDIIFEQWLWAHHDNCETLKNYAWIDYLEIEFIHCQWTNEQLSNINIIQEYFDYVKGRSSYSDINDFCCIEKDLKNWINYSTWRTSPIILDVSSIKNEIPTWSEIKSPYQLVEGHSRLGYLYSMINLDKKGKVKVAPNHSVYIMRFKEKKNIQLIKKDEYKMLEDEKPLIEKGIEAVIRKIKNEI